jgi:adenine deaminase
VLPASVEEKLKLALAELLGLGGPAVIVVSGATRSIVQLCVAGVASVFPAGSVALTWKLCAPSARPL